MGFVFRSMLHSSFGDPIAAEARLFWSPKSDLYKHQLTLTPVHVRCCSDFIQRISFNPCEQSLNAAGIGSVSTPLSVTLHPRPSVERSRTKSRETGTGAEPEQNEKT